MVPSKCGMVKLVNA
ncbi:hypothetical protein LINGRAHAP2_LOCUS14110 [Linum grandiflorum]